MKVAIAGYGQEGEVNYAYWKNLGAQITIFDEKQPTRQLPEGVESHFGKGTLPNLDGFDIVVRTASLAPKKIITDGKVWSATNEFFAECSVPIIGITGTKGKGTTATLISKILEEAGFKTWLIGNIGVPALSVLEEIKSYSDTESDGIVVFELSSFQLWDLEKSPEASVVLMIEPDHQDVHSSMEEYVSAKANIAKFQNENDLLVYHPTNSFSAQIAATSPARKKQYMQPTGANVVNSEVIIEDQSICSVNEVGLLGAHNLENICAAITVAWNFTNDTKAIKQAITEFKGLEHRLELVREISNIRFYNDSFSSAPGATIAAIRSFEVPVVVICGGYDKGIEFTQLASAIAQNSTIKQIILIGQTRHKIASALDSQGITNYETVESTDFSQIISDAYKIAEPGDVVLLSPGCASFDMFKNFYDRGEQFKSIVGRL